MTDGQVLALNVVVIVVGCGAATLALGPGAPQTLGEVFRWLGMTLAIVVVALLVPTLWWVLAGCRLTRLDGPLVLAYIILAAIIVTAGVASSNGPSGPLWWGSATGTP